MSLHPEQFCIGLVLSAGGLRGAAHLGVLRRLVRYRIPVEVMAGVSAGAIIAAYYASVGLTVNDMIELTAVFRGRLSFAKTGAALLSVRKANVPGVDRPDDHDARRV